MQITKFTINSDDGQMEVRIEQADKLIALRLWKNLDYKDFSLAIDLSYMLTSSVTEDLAIRLEDIGETQFDGVYYLQAEEEESVSIAVTADLTRYKECILDKVIQSNLGKPCLVENNVEVINAHMVLVNLAYAVELQFIDEIVNLLTAINVFCSNECKSCGDYDNLTDYSSRVYNDSSFIVDPGNIV